MATVSDLKQALARWREASRKVENFAVKELPPDKDPPIMPGPELQMAMEECEAARREVYRLQKELFGWEPC